MKITHVTCFVLGIYLITASAGANVDYNYIQLDPEDRSTSENEDGYLMTEDDISGPYEDKQQPENSDIAVLWEDDNGRDDDGPVVGKGFSLLGSSAEDQEDDSSDYDVDLENFRRRQSIDEKANRIKEIEGNAEDMSSSDDGDEFEGKTNIIHSRQKRGIFGGKSSSAEREEKYGTSSSSAEREHLYGTSSSSAEEEAKRKKAQGTTHQTARIKRWLWGGNSSSEERERKYGTSSSSAEREHLYGTSSSSEEERQKAKAKKRDRDGPSLSRWKREDVTASTEPPQNSTEEESSSDDTKSGESGGRGSREGEEDGGEKSNSEPEPEPEPAPKRRKGKRRRRPRREIDDIVIQEQPDSAGASATAVDSKCAVSGLWYNPKGSELFLTQGTDGSINGEFRTAVESECGAAGTSHAKVKGYVHGNLVTFHASFAGKTGGRSMTTWIGQCHKQCDFGFFNTLGTDQVVLHTTWLLSSEDASCDNHWSQNRLGQEIFVRKPLSTKGPRKLVGTHTPKREPAAC